jgi:hypothetical protein
MNGPPPTLPPGLVEIVLRHDLEVRGDAQRWAIFSRDELYRYALVTEVNPNGTGSNGFCGLNPSDATHLVNDNTHTKCMEFTKRWGFRWNWMLNAFAWRDKNRSVLKKLHDPVGPANNDILHFAARHLDRVVAAWGADAKLLARGARVKRELLEGGANLMVFRFNDDGSPEHPLYMPYEQAPREWT